MTTMSKKDGVLKNVFKRVGSDYEDVKSQAHLDAETNLCIIDGKRYPYTVDMSGAKGTSPGSKACFKAEILVFETEISRDMYVMQKNGKFFTHDN